MNNWQLIENDIFNQGIHAFCWMLLHSLWQGLILTMLAGLVMSFTKKTNANIRYNLLVALMAAFLITAAITFIYEWQAFGNTKQWISANRWSLGNTTQGQWLTAIATYCSDHAISLLAIWWVLFCFKCWQLGRGVLYLRHIRKGAVQLPAAEWQVRMAIFTEKLQLHKPVRLLESSLTKVPVVIGHFKPVIYMPIGLLTSLPPAQLEAVLLHELAHIRRHDYLINLLQYLAEAVFCCNPGLLWVSALLKQEREHCCDDLALQHTGKKKTLIQALVSFKEYALYGTALTPAFPGQKQHLVQRATRLLQGSNTPLNTRERAFCFVSMMMIALLLGALGTKKIFSTDNTQQRLVQATSHSGQSNDKSGIQMKIQTVPNTPEQPQPQKRIHVQKRAAKPLPEQADKRKQLTADKQKTNKETWQEDYNRAVTAIQITYSYSTKTEYGKTREATEHAGQQIDQDRIQAELDRQQAARDRIQADKDRQRADLDRVQAEKDRIQAEKDRAQAQRDRARAERDRLLAIQDRQSH